MRAPLGIPGRIPLALAAGNGALALFESWETRTLGREPVYAARQIARRWFGFGEHDRRWARVLRGLYTVGLMGALGVLRDRTRLSPPWNGLLLGLGVAAAEWVVMPRLRATPPHRVWSTGESLLLWPHAMSFGVAADLALGTT